MGADQFRKLIPYAHYYEKREGYFSITDYLSDELIKVLFAVMITAQQSVASAA